MAKLSYRRTIVGYHGCDQALADEVLAGVAQLKLSANSYDWLGNGIYFWEHGPRRAYEWALAEARLSGRKVRRPAVLGAKINLGVCLDLLDTANTQFLRRWFHYFRSFMSRNRLLMPQNRAAPGTRPNDKVLRFRDCAVIDFTTRWVAQKETVRFQTVRGVFLEGEPAFPGSKIMLKSHIQIAVRDFSCILGYFLPSLGEYGDQGRLLPVPP